MQPPPQKNSPQPTKIRREQPADMATIGDVHTAAFSTGAEAQLVDTLRRDGDLVVSLVAQLDRATPQNSATVGHIALSPVTLDGRPCSGVGLAPLAVLPEYQRHGIGGQLIEAGLAACREGGFSLVVVLGKPAYYGRFGFRSASEWGLESEYEAGNAFMALSPGTTGHRFAAMPRDGLIRYAAAFAALG